MDEEKEELNQMFFTANFRSFPVLVSEAIGEIVKYLVDGKEVDGTETIPLIHKVKFSDNDIRKLMTNYHSYFNTEKSPLVSGDAVLAIMRHKINFLMKQSTGRIKDKLSGGPLVTVDVEDNGDESSIVNIKATFEN